MSNLINKVKDAVTGDKHGHSKQLFDLTLTFN